jgi:hypothetical protein
MSTPALQDRPLSKTQIFCSNLPWSINGKMLRQAFEVRGRPRLLLPCQPLGASQAAPSGAPGPLCALG